LVQGSRLAIFAVDSKAHILVWNPAAERLFGWSEQDILGRPNPIAPEGKNAEFSALRKRALKGEDLLLEARILSIADVMEATSSHGTIAHPLSFLKELLQGMDRKRPPKRRAFFSCVPSMFDSLRVEVPLTT